MPCPCVASCTTAWPLAQLWAVVTGSSSSCVLTELLVAVPLGPPRAVSQGFDEGKLERVVYIINNISFSTEIAQRLVRGLMCGVAARLWLRCPTLLEGDRKRVMDASHFRTGRYCSHRDPS